MKNTKKSLILLLIIMMITMVAGCSSNKTETKTEENTQAATAVETEVKEESIRVITTYKPATEIVLALGGKDKLVGANDGATSDYVLDSLGLSEAGKIAEIGSKKNGLNIEAIVALKPDVIIMHPTKEGDDTVQKLLDQNIKVVTINPESQELLQADIVKVGEAIGEVENAKKLIAYYDEKIKYITEKLSSVEKRKTVYIAGAHGFLSTCSGDFYQHELVEIAGGIDVAGELKGGWNDVSVEQVISWNPDVIASVMYCPEGKPEDILKRSEIQGLNAVKNKEVYQIPSNIAAWDMPQPTSVLAILWMSKTLYPEVFTDLDIQAEANEYYSSFYGKSFDELGGVLDGEVSPAK